MKNKEEVTISNLTNDDIIMLNLLNSYAKKEKYFLIKLKIIKKNLNKLNYYTKI